MKKIRSRKNNLFNYFAHDHKDLSPGYLKSCEKFFRSIKQRKEKNEKKYDSRF
jgi:hypothetical protein